MPGVYISYPFCAQKCTYCNFASGVSPVDAQRRYERALPAEIARHEWAWPAATIYWGGGTPSLAPVEFVAAVMRSIPSAELVEATLECAPGSVTPERARAWSECGINRVSLGVQSFVTEEARRTGRKHTAATVEADMRLLADCGITNVNVDLIAGLPGQNAASWEASLDWVERLAPPHVSVYLFEMDEDSNLGREALLGGVRYGAALLPGDDAAAGFYERAVERLGALGIVRYEISNFARPGYESRHNLKYWKLEPYAGFGLDAHSFDGQTRSANSDDLEQYLHAVEAGQSPAVETTYADTEEEHFFVGLRLAAGIEPTPNEWRRFEAPIARYQDAGLLLREGARLRLSDRGLLVSNEIFQDFIYVHTSNAA